MVRSASGGRTSPSMFFRRIPRVHSRVARDSTIGYVFAERMVKCALLSSNVASKSSAYSAVAHITVILPVETTDHCTM